MRRRAVPSLLALLAVGLWALSMLGGEAPRDVPKGAAAGEEAGKGTAPKAGGEPDITFVDDDEKDDGESGPEGKAAVNPFGEVEKSSERRDAVPGYLELSKGLKVPGRICTTRAKRLKVFNIQRQLYEYVPVPAIKRMDVVIDWERLDKEWRFKEAGNPEKVYTGRTYPARQLAWKITLRNDHEITGHILGQPLYVEHNGKVEQFLLAKRQKGAMGQTLDDLPYVRRVVFGPEAYNLAVEELKAKAEAAGGAKPAESGTQEAPEKPAP